MRNHTRAIVSAAGVMVLAAAGGIGSAAIAAPTATGAVLGCPSACVGSGGITGGIIRDHDINGLRITARMSMANTYRSVGVVPYVGVASVPVSISIPNVPGWAITTWLRDATVRWNGQTYSATAAVTRANHLVVQSRSQPVEGTPGSFHAELVISGSAVTGAGAGAYYGPGSSAP